MYINYDLARTLLEERRKQALARAASRRRAPEPTTTSHMPDADVIELTFETRCGTEQIGA